MKIIQGSGSSWVPDTAPTTLRFDINDKVPAGTKPVFVNVREMSGRSAYEYGISATIGWDDTFKVWCVYIRNARTVDYLSSYGYSVLCV